MVRLENVSKVYGSDRVVDDVSLSVEKGEILVLIGPSGCGKTTTLKMINQLIPHTSGRISVKGRDVTTIDPVALRREIGYVIQQIGLLPHLTIQDNIAFVLQLMHVPRARQRDRAVELIQTVGLPMDFLKKYPRQLSGGQQQRVGVARALAADPDLILMDEPFGAVDPIAREQLQEELMRLHRSLHKTIVFVTHDMQEAFRLGTRIAIMRAGKLVRVGPAIDLVREKDAFVQDFIGKKAIFDVMESIPARDILDSGVPVFRQGDALPPSGCKGWEHAVVVDGKGRLLGIAEVAGLPEGEVRLTPERIKPPAAFIEGSASVRRAIEQMLWSGHSWLPVVEDGVYRGVVTFDSCARLMRC